jgi:transposase InsO family protein
MHANTKLTPYSREQIVLATLAGEPASVVARRAGISRNCLHKWVRRRREEGVAGLVNRSTRPHHTPHRLSDECEQRILRERARTGDGPNRLALALDLPASTIYVVLRRHGQNRKPRPAPRPIRRYERAAPGSLIHVDFKELAGIGGGTRYQFSMVDDFSREAYAEIVERATTVAAHGAFERGRRIFQTLGVRIQQVMTDNGMQFTMAHTPHPERRTKFQKLLAQQGIKHLRTKPYSPQTNGKVERFHRTVDDELYRVVYCSSEAERSQALAAYLRRYNTRRPHLGIGGLTPAARRYQFFVNQQCHQCA